MNDKLRAQLRALERLTVNAGPVAERVARIAQRLAPVRSGELRDSIHAEGESVVADADHAPFVEFGTRYMRAQPFMRPAVDENERELLELAAQIVEEEIRRAIT